MGVPDLISPQNYSYEPLTSKMKYRTLCGNWQGVHTTRLFVCLYSVHWLCICILISDMLSVVSCDYAISGRGTECLFIQIPR